MEWIDKNTIRLDREINELDKFVLQFLKILEQYTKYVIVSGYVAIVLGRSRATEDVDILIPKMEKQKFQELYNLLECEGFWTLNASDVDELYDLLVSKHSIRFAVKPDINPNIELKFSKDYYDTASLQKPVVLIMGDNKLNIAPLELQIAYKEEVLKSNKDYEDARHIRLVAKEHLDNGLLLQYTKELRGK